MFLNFRPCTASASGSTLPKSYRARFRYQIGKQDPLAESMQRHDRRFIAPRKIVVQIVSLPLASSARVILNRCILVKDTSNAVEQPIVSIAQSRWTFVVLQALDILTTLAAFHVGAFEANPLVARLTREWGITGGLIGGKVIALLIALGVRRRLWIVNVFYGAVVVWNVYVVLSLSARPP